MDELLNSYRVLGLQPGATSKQIKSAYRELVKVWHPDQFAKDPVKRQEAELKLKEINLAFEKLQDAHPTFDLIAALQAAYRVTPSAKTKSPAPSNVASPAQAGPLRPAAAPEVQPNAVNSPPSSATAPAHHPILKLFSSRGPLIASGVVLLVCITAAAYWLSPRPVEEAAEDDFFTPIQEITPTSPGATAPAGRRTATPGLDINAELPSDPSDELPRLPPTEPAQVPLPPATNQPPAVRPEQSAELNLIKELKATNSRTNANPSPGKISETNAEKQFQTALRYAQGNGVPQDFAEAAKWYQLAAQAGHLQAQRNLGFLYASGKGVPQDYDEAGKWLKNGKTEPDVQVANALVSAMAQSQARRAQQPALADDPVRTAAQNFERGQQFAAGRGVAQDYSEAAKWYRLAAEAGHGLAQKQLGYLHISGKGVPKDPVEAEKWLRQAAANGVAEANIAAALLSTTQSNSK